MMIHTGSGSVHIIVSLGGKFLFCVLLWIGKRLLYFYIVSKLSVVHKLTCVTSVLNCLAGVAMHCGEEELG